jgi:hypothetical protein
LQLPSPYLHAADQKQGDGLCGGKFSEPERWLISWSRPNVNDALAAILSMLALPIAPLLD